MKITLETINPIGKSPFRLLHNPHLNELYFWHFHPEYELVYIEGANATRHVGNHIYQFKNDDLVLIGSNIPHLNFDYRVTTKYHIEVLHIKTFFIEQFLTETPEMKKIAHLFERSRYGIAFYGTTKKKVGELLKKLEGKQPFKQFMQILSILEILSDSSEYELLHTTPVINNYNKKEQNRLRIIYAFIDKNYQNKINVGEVAALCNLSKPAFCRYFKKATDKTFISFLNEYRISQAKRLLMIGKNVSETCYECGFESLSYFNRTFKKVTNENPSFFKNQHTKKYA